MKFDIHSRVDIAVHEDWKAERGIHHVHTDLQEFGFTLGLDWGLLVDGNGFGCGDGNGFDEEGGRFEEGITGDGRGCGNAEIIGFHDGDGLGCGMPFGFPFGDGKGDGAGKIQE